MAIVPERTRRAVLGGGLGALAATHPSAQPVQDRAAPGPVAARALRPNSDQDQTAVLQRALTGAARDRMPVRLPSGRYRVGGLTLPSGVRLIGAGVGATVLVQAGAEPLIAARGGEQIALRGMTLEGSSAVGRAAPLVSFADVTGLDLVDLALTRTRGTAVRVERCGGRIERCSVSDVDIAIVSLDAAGLQVVGNVVENCRNNGIQIWRSQKGYDGTQVLANRIGTIKAEAGGSGQNGNGINVFRAGGVIPTSEP
jgi:uncharacterized secreted repeat protein (TIGR03808 family)